MKQDLFFLVRIPQSTVYFVMNGEIQVGNIKKFKVHVEKGNKRLRKNPINLRWSTPAYPVRTYYKVIFGSYVAWLPSDKVFDSRQDVINSLQ